MHNARGFDWFAYRGTHIGDSLSSSSKASHVEADQIAEGEQDTNSLRSCFTDISNTVLVKAFAKHSDLR